MGEGLPVYPEGYSRGEGIPLKVLYADGDNRGRVAIHIQYEEMPRGTVVPKQQPPIRATETNTNNESEWEALLYALELVDSCVHAEIRLDSMCVVAWMEGLNRTRDPRMLEYKRRAQQIIIDRGLNVRLRWVRRIHNEAGKRLERLNFPEDEEL